MTVVIPPAAADIVPVVKSSRSVWPGSSKCACGSIAPGRTKSPDTSMRSSHAMIAPCSVSPTMRPPSITTSAARTAVSVATVPPERIVRFPVIRRLLDGWCGAREAPRTWPMIAHASWYPLSEI